jgi:hypothetical protein
VVCGYGNYSSEELVEGGIANLCHAILRDGLAGQLVARPARTNLDGRGRDRPLAKPADLRWYSHNICGGRGYTCFAYVSIAEGRRYFRVHAEMALAAEIHRVLVPTIDIKSDGFEFYGRSLPSGEVGGDLVDVFQTDRGWIAYIADVSGHGVAPGVVMGMVKSAARMQLSSTEESAALLEHLNSVLIPIKKPEMFVTFAYLAWNGERLQYSLAGHPPILHYHALTREISELACSNLPLGMFSGGKVR